MTEVKLTEVNRYEEWLQSEGIPVVRGFFVEDVNALELGWWPRMGGLGAYINFDACSGLVNAYVCEMPPGASLAPQKHLFEEVIYVLKGMGFTSVWNEGGAKQTFEWGEGSLFAIPLNVSHQHFNGSAASATRYVAITNAPLVINLFHNLDFVFANPFVFQDRFSGQPDYWNQETVGRIGKRKIWLRNLVPDLMSLEIPPSIAGTSKGNAGRVYYVMADSTLAPFVGEQPPGTYVRAHRHGPTAHILTLAGKGYTLLWREGEERMRVDWKPGSMMVPPNQWFHQHFNPGHIPERSLRVSLKADDGTIHRFGKLLWPTTARDEIAYEDDAPEIRSIFESELARTGVKLAMP